jgi:DNA-binding MarR family transcriptional regulator
MKYKNMGEFTRVFGATPRNRVIEFFLEMPSIEFSTGQIIEEIELTRATTYSTINDLIEEGYIKPTRRAGGAQLYKLNNHKKEVKILLKVFDILLKNIVEEYKKKEKVAA